MKLTENPKTREEFITALKQELDCTNDQIAIALKEVEQKLEDNNIVDKEQIKQEYGFAFDNFFIVETIEN